MDDLLSEISSFQNQKAKPSSIASHYYKYLGNEEGLLELSNNNYNNPIEFDNIEKLPLTFDFAYKELLADIQEEKDEEEVTFKDLFDKNSEILFDIKSSTSSQFKNKNNLNKNNCNLNDTNNINKINNSFYKLNSCYNAKNYSYSKTRYTNNNLEVNQNNKLITNNKYIQCNCDLNNIIYNKEGNFNSNNININNNFFNNFCNKNSHGNCNYKNIDLRSTLSHKSISTNISSLKINKDSYIINENKAQFNLIQNYDDNASASVYTNKSKIDLTNDRSFVSNEISNKSNCSTKNFYFSNSNNKNNKEDSDFESFEINKSNTTTFISKNKNSDLNTFEKVTKYLSKIELLYNLSSTMASEMNENEFVDLVIKAGTLSDDSANNNKNECLNKSISTNYNFENNISEKSFNSYNYLNNKKLSKLNELNLSNKFDTRKKFSNLFDIIIYLIHSYLYSRTKLKNTFRENEKDLFDAQNNTQKSKICKNINNNLSNKINSIFTKENIKKKDNSSLKSESNTSRFNGDSIDSAFIKVFSATLPYSCKDNQTKTIEHSKQNNKKGNIIKRIKTFFNRILSKFINIIISILFEDDFSNTNSINYVKFLKSIDYSDPHKKLPNNLTTLDVVINESKDGSKLEKLISKMLLYSYNNKFKINNNDLSDNQLLNKISIIQNRPLHKSLFQLLICLLYKNYNFIFSEFYTSIIFNDIIACNIKQSHGLLFYYDFYNIIKLINNIQE